jgi:hypothetical protein
MTIEITLPDYLAEQLRRKAAEQQATPEAVAIDLLEAALGEDLWPTPEEVVAKIKATPPDPGAIRPAEGSLADYLRQREPDPEFDIEGWNRGWEAVEAELKMMTRANDIAEGRI